MFIVRTDIEAETPIFWPPDAKNWLIWKDPYWERLKAGGEGDDRRWDGWMALPTQWTWVWVNFASSWWTGRHGMLQSMGSQRVGHNWSDLACMHALEQEMATHSSVLAWRIPGMEKPGGLPSMGLHRVRHNWSDFAASSSSNNNPICETAKETQMYRTVFWTLWEKARVGWSDRIVLKHVY